jgi:cytochrome c-type biogenesis protein
MPSITFPVALAAGILSFLSPCILPLVPVYIANIAGSSVLTDSPPGRGYILLHTVSFIAGFSLVFVALGASLGLVGAMIPTQLLQNIAGVVLIIFGLFLIAANKLAWLNYEKRLSPNQARGTGYLRSLSVGAIFAFGWTPCVGPVLGGILALSWSSQTAWQGVYLLLAYSLGLGIPFIVVGLALGAASRSLRWLSRHSLVTTIVSAALLITIGILMLTGNLYEPLSSIQWTPEG